LYEDAQTINPIIPIAGDTIRAGVEVVRNGTITEPKDDRIEIPIPVLDWVENFNNDDARVLRGSNRGILSKVDWAIWILLKSILNICNEPDSTKYNWLSVLPTKYSTLIILLSLVKISLCPNRVADKKTDKNSSVVFIPLR